MKRALLVLALVLATFPASAVADGQSDAEMRIARDYWAANGVTGCPDATLEIAPIGDWKLGEGADCHVRIADGLAWSARRHHDWLRRAIMERECATVVHEFGHALGLGHTASGIMAENAVTIPDECETWAQSFRFRPRWRATMATGLRLWHRQIARGHEQPR